MVSTPYTKVRIATAYFRPQRSLKLMLLILSMAQESGVVAAAVSSAIPQSVINYWTNLNAKAT